MAERTELWLVRMPAGVRLTTMQNAVEFALVSEPLEGDDTVPDTAELAQPTVCGVWREPSSFCQCKRTGDTKKGGFVLGQKFGWWVHSACRKPSPSWRSGLASALFHALGRNQLPDPPEEFRYEPRPSREMLEHVGVQLRLGHDHPYHREPAPRSTEMP